MITLSKDTGEGVIHALLEAMNMQERREKGEFRLSAQAALALWTRAKMRAERYLEQAP